MKKAFVDHRVTELTEAKIDDDNRAVRSIVGDSSLCSL